MSPTDKAPESQNAPVGAAPAAPAETAVTPAAIADGSKRETKTKLADLDADFRKGQSSDEVITAAAAAAGIPADAVPPVPDDTSSVSGGWGALSGMSGFFTHISDAFGDIGKKFSEWLKALMGTKGGDGEEGADTDVDDDDDMDANTGTDLAPPVAAPVAPERVAEDSEMQTPNAPVFSFLKSYKETLYVSSVPCIRKKHPVSGKPMVPHEGVDIPAPIGTPLHLTNSMTILSKGGSTLRGRLDDGTMVSFLHLNKMTSAKVGDRLPRGAWFADVGNKGGSTGPHLHFEVNDGESDPLLYLDPGLLASAEEKIQKMKTSGEWIPLESDEHEHGLA